MGDAGEARGARPPPPADPFDGVRRTSPEGRAPSRASSHRWLLALVVVLPLLFIGGVGVGYAMGGPWLALGVALLMLTVVVMRSAPVLLAGSMRSGDRKGSGR